MVLLLSNEMTAPAQRAAHALLLLFFVPSLHFSPFCLSLCSPPLSPVRAAAAESLLSLQASAAPVKVLEWMLGFHCAQLLTQCTGMQRDREEALPPSTPLHLNHHHHHPASLLRKSQWRLLCASPWTPQMSWNPSLSFFFFCLMSKARSDSSHQVNTWVMKQYPHAFLGSRCLNGVRGPNTWEGPHARAWPLLMAVMKGKNHR